MAVKKEYLGDAVYCEWDGHHIILTTENGIRSTNTICLEQTVFQGLLDYASKVRELNRRKP